MHLHKLTLWEAENNYHKQFFSLLLPIYVTKIGFIVSAASRSVLSIFPYLGFD